MLGLRLRIASVERREAKTSRQTRWLATRRSLISCGLQDESHPETPHHRLRKRVLEIRLAATLHPNWAVQTDRSPKRQTPCNSAVKPSLIAEPDAPKNHSKDFFYAALKRNFDAEYLLPLYSCLEPGHRRRNPKCGKSTEGFANAAPSRSCHRSASRLIDQQSKEVAWQAQRAEKLTSSSGPPTSRTELDRSNGFCIAVDARRGWRSLN